MKNLPFNLGFILALLLFMASCRTQNEKSEVVNQRPNILLLIADDMGLVTLDLLVLKFKHLL